VTVHKVEHLSKIELLGVMESGVGSQKL